MRKNNVKKRHGSRGMTLVELLLVMAILSIVMLAVISLYIPAYQSTVVQTQVSDVQGHLRLALKTMTRDLLIAGFLMPYDPIAFPDAAPDYYVDTPTSGGTENSADFIIRTRAVGSDFARISIVGGVPGDVALTVTDSEMVENFPVGSRVRLFEPVTGTEVKKDTGNPEDRVYTVLTSSGSTINITSGALLLSDILEETVMIRVRDVSAPALQTIRYTLSNGELRRTVNNQVQFLARNLDTSDTTVGGPSFFDYDYTAEGRVKRVDVKLTGQTRALKDDAISDEKRRAIETSVKLRNVN